MRRPAFLRPFFQRSLFQLIGYLHTKLTDRQSPNETMFDLERLSAALCRHSRRAPQEIVTAIVSELDQFSGGVEPEDDQTLLVVGVD